MDEQEFFEQNPWWKDKSLIEKDYDIVKWNEKKYKWIPEIIEQVNLEPFSLHVLSGPRQAGKTTTIKLLIKKLLKENEAKSIFFFSCEDIADYKELLEILNFYIQFKEANSIKSSIIMLDEITSPKEWYRAVKSLIDKGKFRNDVLILTGSSSINVRKEVELFPGRRGNGKDFVLYPLSFRSFLKVIDSELVKKLGCFNTIDDIHKKVLNSLMFEKELNKYLEKYMEYGGFPLSVASLDANKEEAKRVYLNWIKNAILKADRSDVIARQIIKVIVETLQSSISWETISKKIEIKSPKTASAYVELLKSIFAVNILYNLDLEGKKIRFGKNKKIHLRDPLLLEIFEEWCLIKSQNKISAIAESLVVEHLTRMFPERVFFWKNATEIDAIVLDKNKLYGFEVKWSEKTVIKVPNQIKNIIVITKKEYAKSPLKLPLSVFLSIFDI